MIFWQFALPGNLYRQYFAYGQSYPYAPCSIDIHGSYEGIEARVERGKFSYYS